MALASPANRFPGASEPRFSCVADAMVIGYNYSAEAGD